MARADSRRAPAGEQATDAAPAPGPVVLGVDVTRDRDDAVIVAAVPTADGQLRTVVLDDPDPAPAGDVDEHDQAAARLAFARAELATAEALAARLPGGGGYVIAVGALYVPGGARAHNPGDRVPAGNVALNGWQQDVRPAGAGE